MAIAQVQKAGGTGTNTTVTATFGSTPASGNRLIAVFGQAEFFSGNISPPAGWTEVTHLNTGASDGTVAIYEKKAGGSEPTAVTFTNTGGAAGNMTLKVFEYSGLDSATLAADKFTSLATAGSITSASTGTTAATTVADEVVIAAAFNRTVMQTFSSATNSFNDEGQIGQLNVVSKIVSATGTQETTITWSSAVTNAVGIIATFKILPVVTGWSPHRSQVPFQSGASPGLPTFP